MSGVICGLNSITVELTFRFDNVFVRSAASFPVGQWFPTFFGRRTLSSTFRKSAYPQIVLVMDNLI